MHTARPALPAPRRPAALALLAGALWLGTSMACAPSDDGLMTLRVETTPAGEARQAMGHWTYTLESPVVGRLEVSLVDVRRPEQGVHATFDAEAGAPVALDCFLPYMLEPWTERPRFAYELKFDQGDRSERASGLLPEDLLPAVLASPIPGPSFLSRQQLTFAPDTPVVLGAWICPSAEPPGDGGYGVLKLGPAGEPGGPFEVADTIYHGTDQLVADYAGALLQLRLRLTPTADG